MMFVSNAEGELPDAVFGTGRAVACLDRSKSKT